MYSSCCVGCRLCVGIRACMGPVLGAREGKGGWGTTPRGKPGGIFWSSSCVSALQHTDGEEEEEEVVRVGEEEV